jgi:hypothetical protein
MEQKYLSTDPNAGQPVAASGYLSTDPNAGEVVAEGEKKPGLLDSVFDFAETNPIGHQRASARILRNVVGAVKGTGQLAKDLVTDPRGTVGAIKDGLVETGKNLANPETRAAATKSLAEGAAGTSLEQLKKDPWLAVGDLGSTFGMAYGGTKALQAGKRMVQARKARKIVQATERADMEKVARGLSGDVPPEVVARGLSAAPPTEEMLSVARGLSGDVPDRVVADGLSGKPSPNAPRLVKKPVTATAAGEGIDAARNTVTTKPVSTLPQPAVDPFAATERGRAIQAENVRRMRAQQRGEVGAKGKGAAPVSASKIGQPGSKNPNTGAPKPEAKIGPDRATILGSPAAQAVIRKAAAEGNEAAAKLLKEIEPPTPTASLPASWQVFAGGGAAPGRQVVAGIGPRAVDAIPDLQRDTNLWTKPSDALDAGDARAAVGAEKAGRMLDMEPEQVRDLTGGPSRQPLAKIDAEMDSDYRRRLGDEKGAIDPKLLKALGLGAGGAAYAATGEGDPIIDAILGGLAGLALSNPKKAFDVYQQLRVAGFLSGLAPIKSAAGNIGAVGTKAFENWSTRPIVEAMRVPTNTKNFIHAWKNPENPEHYAGVGKINLPGRFINAGDRTTTKLLQRAGVSLDEAQEVLLTAPNALGNGTLEKFLRTRLGQFLVPFRQTPVNAGVEGGKAINELFSNSSWAGKSGRRKALTAASIPAGYVAGQESDNLPLLMVLTALAGPRGIPMGLGMGLGAANDDPGKAGRIFQRIGLGLPDMGWEDVYSPFESLNRPALLRLMRDE